MVEDLHCHTLHKYHNFFNDRNLHDAIINFTENLCTKTCIHTFLDESVQFQTFNQLQKELQSFISTDKSQIIPYLSHINALMHQAVSTCKAALKTSEPPQEFGEKENIPPRKSLEHQWRFMKTFKSPGRKKEMC